MANRKGKICRFTPYKDDNRFKDDNLRLDIELLKSLRHKFKDDTEIKLYLDKVISKLCSKISRR